MLWRMSADTLTETSATMSICQHTGDGQLQSRHDETRAALGPAGILSAAGPYSGGKVFPVGAPESVSTRSFFPPRQTASRVAENAETRRGGRAYQQYDPIPVLIIPVTKSCYRGSMAGAENTPIIGQLH